MELKDKVIIKIRDMSTEGSGIGKTEEGMTVFVSGGVLGDLVEAEITKVKKNYALGECTKIMERSDLRQEQFCEWQDACGGCGLGELSYGAQIKLKEDQIRNKLIRIGGIENPPLKPIEIPKNSEDIFKYRNKAVMAVGEDDKGNPVVGFRERKTGRVIDCKECKLQAEPAMAAAAALRKYMIGNGVSAYNSREGKGLIRHLIVKTAFATGEVMATLVINGDRIPSEEEYITLMDEAIEALNVEKEAYSLECLAININKARTGEVLGDKIRIIAGKDSIEDIICGLRFQVSPLSFYQVNPVMAQRLYEKVMDYLGITYESRIMDLYCGVGTMGIIAASRGAKSVIGVEEIPGAIIDANRNAVINRIVNAVFYRGKTEDLITGEEKELDLKDFDGVIVDPPRKGCDPKVMDAIAKSGLKKMVYVSCNPATMARDLKLLGENGFLLKEITPFDLFPNTTEVECVAVLERK